MLAIAGDKVNLRTEPITRARVLRQLDDGDPVEFLRWSDDGKWAQVRTSDGTAGWVLGRYIRER